MADGDEHLGQALPASLVTGNAQAAAVGLGLQENGQGQGYVARQAAGAPVRTIVSGVERLKAAAQKAEGLLGEFEGFVSGMLGEDGQKQAATPDLPPGAGTVSVVHDAADAVESVFARMADLVKRAKAAHG